MISENPVYCSMIHGGLSIGVRNDNVVFNHCCLIPDRFVLADSDRGKIWNNASLIPLRELNKHAQEWHTDCLSCKKIEDSGSLSMRTGMNTGLRINGSYDLKGPARLDLLFDNSCNLACRTCGPNNSTFWQKHLSENNVAFSPVGAVRQKENILKILSSLDLSNLRQVVFSGGETLLGNEYWAVAKWLVNNVPNAKEQLTLCFQTNGTQQINQKHFDIINKTLLTKLHISIDGYKNRFEYLRWPAIWNETVENLLEIRNSCPSNVMFVIEETISIFNLYYINEVKDWCSTYFNANKDGDSIEYSMHFAHGIFSVQNLTTEYVDTLRSTNTLNLNFNNFKEDVVGIKQMIAKIEKFDNFRNQSFGTTFPEVAEFYHRFV